jgi:hypothetical protein
MGIIFLTDFVTSVGRTMSLSEVEDHAIKSYAMIDAQNGIVHSYLGSKSNELTLEFLYKGIINKELQGKASLVPSAKGYNLNVNGRTILYFNLV